MVIQLIARNFNCFASEVENPTGLKCMLSEEDWDHLLEVLPTDMPLQLSVYIPDSYYWKRACRERWKKSICELNDGSWKQFYMERSCQEVIECLRPSQMKRFHASSYGDTWGTSHSVRGKELWTGF
uniref:Uncharacterized protein n=1 Tax=Cacopsylla melanoneura TaxID=428564 RepID=A0A8D8WRY7_9HEMI